MIVENDGNLSVVRYNYDALIEPRTFGFEFDQSRRRYMSHRRCVSNGIDAGATSGRG